MHKTAGTAVDHAMRTQVLGSVRSVLGSNKMRVLNPVKSDKSARKHSLSSQEQRIRTLKRWMNEPSICWISGHFRVEAELLDEYKSNVHFLTLLRDPVRRWISHYFYNAYKKRKHYRIDENIEEFIDSERAKSYGRDYVSLLSGHRNVTSENLDSAIDSACRNLHLMNFVGITEHMESLEAYLSYLYDTDIKFSSRRASPVSKQFRDSVLTTEIRQKIFDVCAPDRAVYEYALSRFGSYSSKV